MKAAIRIHLTIVCLYICSLVFRLIQSTDINQKPLESLSIYLFSSIVGVFLLLYTTILIAVSAIKKKISSRLLLISVAVSIVAAFIVGPIEKRMGSTYDNVVWKPRILKVKMYQSDAASNSKSDYFEILQSGEVLQVKNNVKKLINRLNQKNINELVVAVDKIASTTEDKSQITLCNSVDTAKDITLHIPSETSYEFKRLCDYDTSSVADELELILSFTFMHNKYGK
jgi:hypothetical protein